MKLYISANIYTDKQKQDAQELTEVLKRKGHIICDLFEEADYIVSLGGDGALLKAAQKALAADKPLIGINAGRKGYLCLMKQDEIEDFDEIVKRSVLTRRTTLECEFEGKKFLAVNDIVVSKVNFGETVDLHYDTLWNSCDLRGDGLIVSTPTGSSAYNLAAGGPLIDYNAKVLSLTPICTHNSYPSVISDDQVVTAKVNHGQAKVYADGKDVGDTDESVIIRKADKVLKLCSKY